MDINKIMSADILDLIFEGRNKEYGAYELRKSYNRRLAWALIGTAIACILLIGGYFLSNAMGGDKDTAQMVQQDINLEEIKEEKKEEPPPPPPPKPEPPKVEIAKFTPPKIVKDEEVKEDEKPPEIEKLEDTAIRTASRSSYYTRRQQTPAMVSAVNLTSTHT